MRRTSRRTIVTVGLCVYLLVTALAHARDPVPVYNPQGYVSDHAGVIEAEWRERIRSVCQDLERKTGVEMVVVTVPALKPYGSANDYATALHLTSTLPHSSLHPFRRSCRRTRPVHFPNIPPVAGAHRDGAGRGG